MSLLTLIGAGPKTGGPWYKQNNALVASLVGLWRLDEVSGNAVDSVGSSTLTDNATVTSAAGVLYSLAREFVIANSESLSAADSATLSAGNIDMWGSVWCYPSAINVTTTIFGKWNTSGNREWQIAQVNADVILQTSPDGTATGNGLVTATGVLVANTWTHIVWYHDSVNNLIGLSINGGAFATAAYTTGIFNSAASFRVGGQGAGAAFFGGRIQEACLGKNYIPTLLDSVSLFNHGVASGVRAVNFLGSGGEIDWSPDGTQLVFDKRDDNGDYQLHLIRPNGRNDICLTCSVVAGGPSVARHKGFPAWHPSGNYIVCQVEMETHNAARDLSEPGRGNQCNMWVLTPDGQTWWQLTDYSTTAASGLLNPRFSPDGTKLLWAQKIGAVTAEAPFGVWNLQLADFTLPGGVPTISNITTLTPGSKTFYESHGFNRQSTKILYCSDPDTGNLYGFDIFSADLDGSNVVNLTASDAQWDEHAHYAPHVDKIAYMSSRPYTAYTATDLTGLKSEIFIMNADGTDKRQLTHFNVAGFPEYNAEPSVATTVAWKPSGRRLAVVQLLLGASYDTVQGRMLWIIDFNNIYS